MRPIINRIVDRHNKIDYSAVDSMIDKKQKQGESASNNFTYQLNARLYSDNQYANKQSHYNKIEYPSFLNNSIISYSPENKKKAKLNEIFNHEFKSKFKKDNIYALNKSSQHFPIKSSYQMHKSNGVILEKISQLRKDIEHTKKYFSYVK